MKDRPLKAPRIGQRQQLQDPNRDRQVLVRLNVDEHDELSRAAQACGDTSLASYVRRQALAAARAIGVPASKRVVK